MRLIDADAFRWWVDDYYDCTELGQIVTEWINDRPTIEAEPVRRGRWGKASPFTDTIVCSNCGYNWPSEEMKSNYCPNCGAKMEDE